MNGPAYNRESQEANLPAATGGVLSESNPQGLRSDRFDHPVIGRLAQPVAALPLHGRGRGFDPLTAHQTIPTSKGRLALIDKEDFVRFGHLKWTAGSFGGRTSYVYRSEWGEDGKCRTILLHRLIMGAGPSQIVDHRSSDTFDNRRSNLRFATTAQNTFNRRQAPSRHGFIGIDSQTPGRFRGRVTAGGKSHYTATFPCPILAAVARDVIARQIHGEFAVLNFPYVRVVA